jgi:hypothetical protein
VDSRSPAQRRVIHEVPFGREGSLKGGKPRSPLSLWSRARVRLGGAMPTAATLFAAHRPERSCPCFSPLVSLMAASARRGGSGFVVPFSTIAGTGTDSDVG